MTLHTHTGKVARCASWARDVTASDEIRTAAICALVKCEDTNPAAADALAAIKDPIGIKIRTEARNVLWSDRLSDLTPFGRDLRRQMQAGPTPICADMAEAEAHFGQMFTAMNARRAPWWQRIGAFFMAALFGVSLALMAAMLVSLPVMQSSMAAQAVARGL